MLKVLLIWIDRDGGIQIGLGLDLIPKPRCCLETKVDIFNTKA